MNKENTKKVVSRILKELEPLLHRAIDEDRTGSLTVFEMIIVSADTLDRVYKTKKKEKEEPELAEIIQFKPK